MWPGAAFSILLLLPPSDNRAKPAKIRRRPKASRGASLHGRCDCVDLRQAAHVLSAAKRRCVAVARIRSRRSIANGTAIRAGSSGSPQLAAMRSRAASRNCRGARQPAPSACKGAWTWTCGGCRCGHQDPSRSAERVPRRLTGTKATRLRQPSRRRPSGTGARQRRGSAFLRERTPTTRRPAQPQAGSWRLRRWHAHRRVRRNACPCVTAPNATAASAPVRALRRSPCRLAERP